MLDARSYPWQPIVPEEALGFVTDRMAEVCHRVSALSRAVSQAMSPCPSGSCRAVRLAPGVGEERPVSLPLLGGGRVQPPSAPALPFSNARAMHR